MAKEKKDHSLLSFSIELLIYAALVAGYMLLVARFLGHWLADLHEEHRHWYAFVALALIVAQGVLLETITTGLLSFIQSKLDK